MGRRLLLVFLCLPCLCFIAGTVVVQSAGIDTRARVMVTSLMALLAVLAFRRWLPAKTGWK